MIENKELALARDFVEKTDKHLFLTGKAGTGKTTFLKTLKEHSTKRTVVAAPTGVAAINAGGVTLHSLFQLPFGPILSKSILDKRQPQQAQTQKFNKRKINLLKSIELLVIDEISMVRADMLDGIDEILRRYKNRFLPFGGVQLLMIGDMQQLPPVVKREEWEVLRHYYPSLYFFHAHAFRDTSYLTIELKHVYRQADRRFINILNEIRDNRLSEASYEELHKRYIPNFKPNEEEGYITLTTHNRYADTINLDKLELLPHKKHRFKASIEGNFPDYAYPTDKELLLKMGAQVMFIKNDLSSDKRYYNGKIGKITGFEQEAIIVQCPGEPVEIRVEKARWDNIRYSVDPKNSEVKEEVQGSFTQYPLRLAWAITIHKSQGLTFDKAVIDANAAFAHGQTYVALSRCKSLEGMVLTSKISRQAIICDSEISRFNRQIEEQQPDEKDLRRASLEYEYKLLEQLFLFDDLRYLLEGLEKTFEKHRKSIHGNLYDIIRQIQKEALPELTRVGSGFLRQIKQLWIAEQSISANAGLSVRLQKAGSWFSGYLSEKLLKPIAQAGFESDNKAAGKAVGEVMESLNEALSIRQNSMKVLQEGFSLKGLLDARARGALKPTANSQNNTPKNYVKSLNVKHQELFNMLKFWRNEMAEMMQKPHYVFASTRTLMEIADRLPLSTKELKKIHGVGKAKIEAYGDDWIDMVKEYMMENNITPPKASPEQENESKEQQQENPDSNKQKNANEGESKKKIVRGQTQKISLEMFRQGKDIASIAAERGLKEITIEGHMAYWIERGELSLADVVADPASLVPAVLLFKEQPELTLNEALNLLKQKLSYGKLRMARSTALAAGRDTD